MGEGLEQRHPGGASVLVGGTLSAVIKNESRSLLLTLAIYFEAQNEG
jgi:hypothetical protein